MRLRPTLARAIAGLAAMAALSACATDGLYMGAGAGRHAERAAPANQAMEWSPSDRFYRTVTLERAEGGRERDAAESALQRANLLAPVPATARYGLTISRQNDRGGEALTHYLIVDRASGRPVFEQETPIMRGGGSMTSFIVALGAAEHVTVATVVPCIDSAEIRAMKGALTARGATWRTDDCLAYSQGRADGGVRYPASYR